MEKIHTNLNFKEDLGLETEFLKDGTETFLQEGGLLECEGSGHPFQDAVHLDQEHHLLTGEDMHQVITTKTLTRGT